MNVGKQNEKPAKRPANNNSIRYLNRNNCCPKICPHRLRKPPTKMTETKVNEISKVEVGLDWTNSDTNAYNHKSPKWYDVGLFRVLRSILKLYDSIP